MSRLFLAEMRPLIDMILRLLDQAYSSESEWCLSVEHKIHALQGYLCELSHTTGMPYTKYLRTKGFSRNGFTIAMAMRYLAVEDYAEDPILIDKSILGALKPVLSDYKDSSCRLRVDTVRPDADIQAWLKMRIREHILAARTPSPLGNAVTKEVVVSLNEHLLRSVFPELHKEIGWHLLEFLKAKDVVAGFARQSWEAHTSLFDIDLEFSEFWNFYLEAVGSGLGLDVRAEGVSSMLEHWEAIVVDRC